MQRNVHRILKQKHWNIIILSAGGLLTLFLLLVTEPLPQENPYVGKLITCHGHDMPITPTNTSMAGIVECDNGTLIRVHYVESINGSLYYSGFHITP